ncbi:hypothetical protein GCM10025868_36590 [Angustibacter aerolatus]|uniref:Uncharacterized protein n=1 Tax=Angustibacter aerolatus TaxID=1162965 RepID=A0ABQ6JKL2_9ACTN|nr:hypothetical protein [Angustibacter aerolatus]GMA88409.1 hypothetical protein GCM10025868_36590 [Angustibacter aerolatus]
MRLLIRSGKDPTTVLTAAQTLRRDTIGTNAGNLVFGEAVHRSLSVPRAEPGVDAVEGRPRRRAAHQRDVRRVRAAAGQRLPADLPPAGSTG